MAQKVSIDGLESAIVAELEKYSKDVRDEIKEAAKKTGRECAREIKQKSPGSEYPKYWRSKVAYQNEYGIKVVCYNIKNAWLTHLLEFGHTIKNGTGRTYGRTRAFPHIKPAEENAKKVFEERVKEILRG